MKNYIHEIPGFGEQPTIEKKYDVVIAGGGMGGVCAAIAAARNGAKTAIVQDRCVFGGNASSEIRMHVKGASCHGRKPNAAETGILMELQLHNQYLNENHNFSIWDGVLWSTIKETANLDSYLNTVLYHVESDGTKIQWIDCYQSTTESHYRLRSEIYVDSTGNGTLGYFAGAEYSFGSESREIYQEKSAADNCNGNTMGNSILMCARDTGHPVTFVKPEWAYTFDEDDLEFRHHGNTVAYLDSDKVIESKDGKPIKEGDGLLKETYDCQSGYWWIELGGDWDDLIGQAEDIRYELYRCVYGIWDHIKNRGDHGAENYELIWVGSQSGIREGRRFEGLYTLTENDIRSNRISKDDVAYGGWPMDNHSAGGLRAKGEIPSHVFNFEGLYGIPYGCYCSKTISNLMLAGRVISASKMAMSSTRLMGTCSVGGQAVGTAAALAIKHKCTPAQIQDSYIEELRQTLLHDDCYIMGAKNTDPNDLALKAKVTASSCKPGAEPENVLNGVTRNEGNVCNMWSSDGISDKGEWLELKLPEAKEISQIRLTFDPNLSAEHCISLSLATIKNVRPGVPPELVKNYEIELYNKEVLLFSKSVCDNYQRLNIWDLSEKMKADTIKIRIIDTNGCPDARIFEIRIY